MTSASSSVGRFGAAGAALLGLAACGWLPPADAPDAPAGPSEVPSAPSGPSEVADIYGSPAMMGEPDEPPAPALRPLPPLEPEPASLPPDCALDPALLEPHLAATQEGVPVEVRKGVTLVEEVVLPDGTRVRWWSGGCAHHRMVAEFALAEPPADAREEAIRLLSRLTPREGDQVPFLRGLREATALGEGGSFPCGDPTCAVAVEREGGLRLVLTYDFPL